MSTLADRVAAEAVGEANAHLRADNLRLQGRVADLEAQARGHTARVSNLEAELVRRQQQLREAQARAGRAETSLLAARAIAGMKAGAA